MKFLRQGIALTILGAGLAATPGLTAQAAPSAPTVEVPQPSQAPLVPLVDPVIDTVQQAPAPAVTWPEGSATS